MKNDLLASSQTPGMPVASSIPNLDAGHKDITLDGPKEPSVQKERSYILYYRYAKIPSLFKVFQFKGTLQQAIMRGREHCLKMGYLFILVLPFMVDLEDQEQRKAKAPESFEDESALTMRL